jgi:catechol 2,3-dioxygenase-like lactoylglutathione lyase family enzyme
MKYSMLPRLSALSFVSLLLVAASSTEAQRVPESEQIPVDIRRTTLLVRDVDRSLAFWRDALGLKVVYDRVLGEPPNTTRLVLLRANDEFIGNLGIMRRSTDPKDVPVKYERATTGQPILVVNAKDQETRLELIRKVPGVKIMSGPERIEYPSPDGKGTIPVMVTYLWDPDGNFVEVNKILGTPAGVKK